MSCSGAGGVGGAGGSCGGANGADNNKDPFMLDPLGKQGNKNGLESLLNQGGSDSQGASSPGDIA